MIYLTILFNFRHSSKDLLNYIVVSRLLKSLQHTTKFMRDLTMQFESMFTGAVKEPPRFATLHLTLVEKMMFSALKNAALHDVKWHTFSAAQNF